jgi:hypothetical protein
VVANDGLRLDVFGDTTAAGAAIGSCLDVTGEGSNHGQQFAQWPCKSASGTNQDFTPN